MIKNVKKCLCFILRKFSLNRHLNFFCNFKLKSATQKRLRFSWVLFYYFWQSLNKESLFDIIFYIKVISDIFSGTKYNNGLRFILDENEFLLRFLVEWGRVDSSNKVISTKILVLSKTFLRTKSYFTLPCSLILAGFTNNVS